MDTRLSLIERKPSASPKIWKTYAKVIYPLFIKWASLNNKKGIDYLRIQKFFDDVNTLFIMKN